MSKETGIFCRYPELDGSGKGCRRRAVTREDKVRNPQALISTDFFRLNQLGYNDLTLYGALDERVGQDASLSIQTE
jgi:hypothetical protein